MVDYVPKALSAKNGVPARKGLCHSVALTFLFARDSVNHRATLVDEQRQHRGLSSHHPAKYR